MKVKVNVPAHVYRWANKRLQDLQGKTVDGEKDGDEYKIFNALKLPAEWCEVVEDMVLTAEEAMQRNYVTPGTGSWESGFHDGFEDGKEQGRLERDLELRPLVEWYMKNLDFLDGWECSEGIASIIKNLKPLNSDD